MFETERRKQHNYKCYKVNNLLAIPGHSVLHLSSQQPQLNPLKVFTAVTNCSVLPNLTFSTQYVVPLLYGKLCAVTWRVGSTVSPCYTCWSQIFEREGGTDEFEDGGGGESFEIHVASDCIGDAEESDRFWPAVVVYCLLTATEWRTAANELPQQLCTVSCSCVLTVCSVLQTVHCSKVTLAAEQKVTCTVHWQLWARLWHRGDQLQWTCL